MGDHFRPSLAAKSAVITDASLFSMPVSKHPADQLHRPHSLSLLSFSQDDIPTGKAIRPQNEAHPTRKLCGVRKWNQIYVKSTYLHAKAEGKRQINIHCHIGSNGISWEDILCELKKVHWHIRSTMDPKNQDCNEGYKHPPNIQ